MPLPKNEYVSDVWKEGIFKDKVVFCTGGAGTICTLRYHDPLVQPLDPYFCSPSLVYFYSHSSSPQVVAKSELWSISAPTLASSGATTRRPAQQPPTSPPPVQAQRSSASATSTYASSPTSKPQLHGVSRSSAASTSASPAPQATSLHPSRS